MRIIKKIKYKVEQEIIFDKGMKPFSKTPKHSDEEIEVKIEVDSIDQKYALRDFLVQKGFKQSNGIFGAQKDFGIWQEDSTHLVKLQYHNERRFKRLFESTLEWLNLNSK